MLLNILPIILFMLGVLGMVMNSSNMILVLMCMEMMLLSMTLNFLLNASLLKSILGQISAIYVLTTAAVESAMGLSLLISFYKLKGTISLSYLNLLKG